MHAEPCHVCGQANPGPTHPTCSKAKIFWPQVVMKKSAFHCKVNQGEWAAQLVLKRHKLPYSFQGRDFIDSVGRGGVTGCAQFSDGLLVKCQESQSSTTQFQPVWGLHAGGQLAVNFFHLRISSRPWLRAFPTALEREPGLWLSLFFILDSLPLCMPFLTSPIKFALQNSGKASEAEALLCTRGVGPGGLCAWSPRRVPLSLVVVGSNTVLLRCWCFPIVISRSNAIPSKTTQFLKRLWKDDSKL